MESNEIIFKHKSYRDFITLDKQIIYDGMNNQKYIIYKRDLAKIITMSVSTIIYNASRRRKVFVNKRR